MGCGKYYLESKKVLFIKEIAKVRTNESIAERINCCVVTEMGKIV